MSKFLPADILLPDFTKVNGTTWSLIACDQFTGEPEYWHRAESLVGDAESTLNMMIPEAFLSETANRIKKVNATMNDYLESVLRVHKNSMIYIEREQSDGRIRHGIVGMIDLEDYDYHKNSKSPIRATEGTVLSRIPPRVAVRREAAIEMPHIMMLSNDAENRMFDGLNISEGKADAYDFDLMLGGGHIRGRFLSQTEIIKIQNAVDYLYNLNGSADPLLFTVGDGNHSLAAAKSIYEEKKALSADKAKCDPARYALVEIVNIYDEALDFEPIYRVLFNIDADDVMTELYLYISNVCKNVNNNAPQLITCIRENREDTIKIENPVKNITVATLQDFLDEYVSTHPNAEVDYIHGEESLRMLSAKKNTIGFLFDGIKKDGFFDAIVKDGTFPRKTFSMGHAKDKRYYLECRKIK